MWVKALEDFDCPAYKIPKGGVVDIPARYAEAGIEAGTLEESSIEAKQDKRETRKRKPAAETTTE